ncbi:hypothetical protein ACE6H2_011474 [Prunus campanulata]
MCNRSYAVISGLLKSRNKLEKSVAKARQIEKVVWVLLMASGKREKRKKSGGDVLRKIRRSMKKRRKCL